MKVTDDVRVSRESAWRSAVGELPMLAGERGVSVRDPRVRVFIDRNRPFELSWA